MEQKKKEPGWLQGWMRIRENQAEKILKEYIVSEGYAYYAATYYNQPWMLPYFCNAMPCFGRVIQTGSLLYGMLQKQNARLSDEYCKVDKEGSGWLDLNLSAILHERKVVDDEVKESISLVLSTHARDGRPEIVQEARIQIPEDAYPNFLAVAEKQARNEAFLQIARTCMPELKKET